MSVTDAFVPLLSDSASIVMVSSGLGELSCLSPAPRAQFGDQSLTRGGLVELMEALLRDVEDSTYKARGWPESASGRYVDPVVAKRRVVRIFALARTAHVGIVLTG